MTRIKTIFQLFTNKYECGFVYALKKSGYIIIGILVLGGFGMLGYFVGEGVKSEIDLGTEMPLLQNPHADVVAGSGGIKING